MADQENLTQGKEEEVQSLDLNFGLGEEPVNEQEEVEEPVSQQENVIENDLQEVSESEEADEIEASTEDDPEVVPDEAEEPRAEDKKHKQDRKNKPMVPKSRLDEVLAKQKALQKQLDEMKAKHETPEKAPVNFDFESKEREYQNLVLDGEVDKAAKLRSDIRKAERELMQWEMRQEFDKTVKLNQQETALMAAANQLEAEYPVFDQNSSEYNESYTQEVIELRDAFIMRGYDATDALHKAANFVIKSYDLNAASSEGQSTLGKASAPKKIVDEVAKKRSEVSKKIQASNQQPPKLPGESSGNHGEKLFDVNSLSEDEFNALPEATLRRLRGDIY